MQIKGVSIGFTDCDPDKAEAFNRWYDLDHVPENIRLPEILTARRYVATEAMQQAREGVRLPQLADGKGAYLATYFAGTEDSDRVAQSMKEVFDAMWKVRRIYKYARIAFSERFRLRKTYASKAAPVGPDAVPYLGHTGILVSLWEIDEPKRAEIEAWWDEDHLPRIMETPGILGAMRFESVNPASKARFMFHLLTDGDPLEALRNLQSHRESLRGAGRMAPPRSRHHPPQLHGGLRPHQPLEVRLPQRIGAACLD